ncbi:MAG: phosphomannomutase / phosphoglucomutase [Candidatus Diapherotrites archaeon]|nr:phosphomannomutase / phosphoglucomutase [Candidatus Diapherotrites archaeon]
MLRIAYDIRGIYPDDVNEDLAYRVGYVFGRERDTVVVAHDYRRGSEELYNALIEGLKAAGTMVYTIGAVPTPVLSFAVRATEANGGIMVTASHNPPEYNGFKLFDDSGTSLPREEIQGIAESARNADVYESPDGCVVPVDIEEKYASELPPTQRRRIIVDFGNGVGIWYKGLLERQFDVIALNDEIDPMFSSRGPEPTFELADALAERIRDEGADFALLLDGDADRSVFADADGFLNPSLLFTLFGRWFLETGRGKTFIASLDISPRVINYLPGARVIRMRIGTVFIDQKAKEEKAVFAGEYSCHFTAYQFSGHSDPLFFTHVLSHYDLPAEKKKYTFYPLVSESFHVDNPQDYIERAASLGTVLSRIDGVEFMYKNHRVLVRPSNTEPKIRIYVEGPEAENVLKDLADRLGLIS